MGYFRELPNLQYQSPFSNRVSSDSYVLAKNIFRRMKMRDDLQNVFTIFNKYVIKDGARPDTIAEELYGKSTLDWVIIISAGITNIRNDWPLSSKELYDFATKKYGLENINSNHHHETKEFRDRNDQLILPAGLVVDENWSMEYLSGGQVRSTNTPSSTSNMSEKPVKSVTFLEFETRLNEDKRDINVLKPDLLGLFLKDFDRIMKYDKSSQYVNRKLKKTENPRIK